MRAYLGQYLACRPGVSSSYAKLLVATVSKLEQHAGRELAPPDVTVEILADWMREMTAGGLSATTVNDRRRMIRSLLISAYDDGLLDRPPRKVRRLPEQHATPEAWTTAEISAIVATARSLPRPGVAVEPFVGEIPASRWWASLILSTYWTGCRIGALLTTKQVDYRHGQGLLVRRQKNGRGQWYYLPASCCAEIDAILDDHRDLLWELPWHRQTLWRRMRSIVTAAGVRTPRGARNLFHRIRRTNLSYCAASDPAIAQRQADHSDYRTTLASYIDPAIARQVSAADVLPEVEGDSVFSFRLVF